MAFIKKNYRKGHCYYSIVEGYREEGKVKHRTLLYLGRLDNLTEEKGRRIEAAVKGIPLEKRPGIEECIDSLAVCNVKNYVLRICARLWITSTSLLETRRAV